MNFELGHVEVILGDNDRNSPLITSFSFMLFEFRLELEIEVDHEDPLKMGQKRTRKHKIRPYM